MGRVRVRGNEGKVVTPLEIALHMVGKLFRGLPPRPSSRVLDAGCGSGVFVDAVIMWCKRHNLELPEIVCIELDPKLVEIARTKFAGLSKVRVIQGDFLTMDPDELGSFDFIISNPPYISYEKIEPTKRNLYKSMFEVAYGRFDIYMLFFEKALKLLKPGGRLVFITPEKFLYVLSARNLRKLLSRYVVEEIELVAEDAFKGVLAYPAITVIRKEEAIRPTIMRLRDGTITEVIIPRDGSPWISQMDDISCHYNLKLKDVAVRISAGVATGRDDIFIVRKSELPEELRIYAYPTISGAELSRFKPGEVIDPNKLEYVMLVPYDRSGRLLTEEEAKPLIEYLSKWRNLLEERRCVKIGGKKWYALHEDPPLRDILRPKILWADIAREPAFYADFEGRIVPRHTVYYMVPRDPNMIPELLEYLNESKVREWLKQRCQKAANNYIRLQSHILKELPIPQDLLSKLTIKQGLKRWYQDLG
jgi:SAM-dependent methyltransferase